MVNPIPQSFQKIWENWNIRGVILLSLSLQTVLYLFAPLRKRTSSKWVLSVIWLAYLLADWVANFGVGLITERARDTTDPWTPGQNNELVAFWAVFMLLHLGGPDTITAFSVEDNELWLRHLFGCVIQIVASVYIFLLTLPGNTLSIPTILVFIAGSIKYFERIRALYLASMKKFQDSTFKEWRESTPASREIKKDGNYLELGCQYFRFFKPILLQLVPSFKYLNAGLPYFGDFSAEEALGIIEVELNLAYEVLHTKVNVTHSVLGIVLRFICFGSVVASLSIFYFQVKKQGFHEFDVGVTYTLFLGALAFDILAFFLLVSSDWTFASLQNGENESRLGKLKTPIASILRWIVILERPRWHSQGGSGKEVLATPFMLRRWSGSVSRLSWISYMLKVRQSRVRKIKNRLHLACEKNIFHWGLAPHGFIWSSFQKIGFVIKKAIDLFSVGDILDEIRIKTSLFHEPLTKELWLLIFEEIKKKADDPEASIKKIFSAAGVCTLQELDTKGDLKKILNDYYYSKLGVGSDVCTVPWHVVTELLYYTTEKDSNEKTPNNARELSKILSDYMFSLLQSKPTLLNSSSTLWKQLIQEICDDDIDLERESLNGNPEKLLCQKIITEDCCLPEARDILKELRELEEDNKWEIVSKVWVEKLSFAAIHCNTSEHVQQVSNGGELLTFVSLLLHHFNLVDPKLVNQYSDPFVV